LNHEFDEFAYDKLSKQEWFVQGNKKYDVFGQQLNYKYDISRNEERLMKLSIFGSLMIKHTLKI